MPDPMPKRPEKPLSVRHAKFCEGIAAGLSGREAYKAAGYKVSDKSADEGASILSRNSKVKDRIAELRARSAEKADFSRDDMVQWLVDALKTPVGEIDQNHPLAQELTTDEVFVEKKGSKVIKRRIKTVGKNECARLLCDMMGWKAPEKREIDLGTKTLDAVREKALSIVSPLARAIE